MNANEVKRWITQRPFLPFAVVTSSGERHEVTHPENARLIQGGVLHIYTPIESDDAMYEFPPASISVMHITGLDPLPAKTA